MATNNAVNTSLSGQTGTGTFAGSTSATFVTPTLGAATATSVTFSPTTGGNVGTTTNNNASAGFVGEVISSIISSGSPVSFSNNTAKSLTSIALTAGDWDVYGNIYFTGTTAQTVTVSISATDNTSADTSLRTFVAGLATGTAIGAPAPTQRISLGAGATYYLVGNIIGTGTLQGVGGIYARRAR